MLQQWTQWSHNVLGQIPARLHGSPNSLIKLIHQKTTKTNPTRNHSWSVAHRAYSRKVRSKTPGPTWANKTQKALPSREVPWRIMVAHSSAASQSHAKMYVGFFLSLHDCPCATLETIPNFVNFIMYVRMCWWLPKAVLRKTCHCASHLELNESTPGVAASNSWISIFNSWSFGCIPINIYIYISVSSSL